MALWRGKKSTEKAGMLAVCQQGSRGAFSGVERVWRALGRLSEVSVLKSEHFWKIGSEGESKVT